MPVAFFDFKGKTHFVDISGRSSRRTRLLAWARNVGMASIYKTVFGRILEKGGEPNNRDLVAYLNKYVV